MKNLKGQEMASFKSGSTRTLSQDKLDFEGVFSPLVFLRFAQYMKDHSVMEDGSCRASDNWQLGIPLYAYIKSLFRHFVDVWTWHRYPAKRGKIDIEEALCAVIFNASGYLHELIKARDTINECEERATANNGKIEREGWLALLGMTDWFCEAKLALRDLWEGKGKNANTDQARG